VPYGATGPASNTSRIVGWFETTSGDDLSLKPSLCLCHPLRFVASEVCCHSSSSIPRTNTSVTAPAMTTPGASLIGPPSDCQALHPAPADHDLWKAAPGASRTYTSRWFGPLETTVGDEPSRNFSGWRPRPPHVVPLLVFCHGASSIPRT
jgi:hypothetical protein